MIDFHGYQQQAHTTAVYNTNGLGGFYPFFGLAGECGEVMELAKKTLRDHNRIWTPERREMLKKELGDVLWYIAEICTMNNLSLQEVAEENLEKLRSREIRGKLHGEGDER